MRGSLGLPFPLRHAKASRHPARPFTATRNVHQTADNVVLRLRADFDAAAVRALLPSVLPVRARLDVADGRGRGGC